MAFLSFVSRATPLAMASRGERMRTGLPSMETLPSVLLGSAPKRPRNSSLAPEPCSPPIPRISPRAAENDTLSTCGRWALRRLVTERFSTRRASEETWGVWRGNCSSISRPTIHWMSFFSGSSGARALPTSFPSRRTVILSASLWISSSRWVIYTIPLFSLFSCLTRVKRVSTSCALSALDGSSMMRTRAFSRMALVISMSCWTEMGRSSTNVADADINARSAEDFSCASAVCLLHDKARAGHGVPKKEIISDAHGGDE